MKLTQLQEATYHASQQGWVIQVEVGYDNQTVGPFSSKQEATEFINLIISTAKQNTTGANNWYDDNEFDLYDKPVKLISPRDLAKRLKL